MHIYLMGWNWKHPDTLAIERPNGHFGLQVIVVRSKGRLVMGDKEYRVDKNTAFVVESCLPHCIYADGEEYADDWIRFSLDKEDNEFIESLNLEYNTPIKLKNDSISKLISAGTDIFNSDITVKNEMLNYILKAILCQLSEYKTSGTKKNRNYYDKALDKIKKDIYSNPSDDWSVPNIAEKLNISVSHFQRLYKKRFGVSCTNDVFISRMQYAKQLILQTDYPVKEIAYMCGYQNYEYFSRSFVKYACISPTQYREKFKEI
ncbi:MAG: helix-turn-helix domain-containing protein [Ruminococcus sp.]|nr:helix-turn-helix domain-containing protein [Ruminococcus sp.]